MARNAKVAELRERARTATRDGLARLGYSVHRTLDHYHYVPDVYGSSWHKLEDIRELSPFGELARAALETGRCMLYYDRLHTLFQALESLRSKTTGPLTLVEIGVFRGGTLRFLARTAAALGLDARLLGFDTFEGHAAADIHANDVHVAGQFGDNSFDDVRASLTDLGNVELVRGRFQDRIAALDGHTPWFVHLDVDLYEPTLFALHCFAERMPRGGVIVIDDFRAVTCPGIERAIREFQQARPGVYDGLGLFTGQYYLLKTAG